MGNREQEPKRNTELSRDISPHDFLNQAAYIVASHKPEGYPEGLEVTMKMDYEPYPFKKEDLSMDRLMPGILYTLAQFYLWRDEHPDEIRAFISQCNEQLKVVRSENTLPARITRSVLPTSHRVFARKQMGNELKEFGIRNMAEVLDVSDIQNFISQTLPYANVLQSATHKNEEVIDQLRRKFSFTGNNPELKKLEEHLSTLYHILPEKVIKEGAMGKVARTILGVMAIAEYDVRNAPEKEKKQHLLRVAHGAVGLGVAYSIIDDTLQDMSSTVYFSQKEREQYHQLIQEGLRTGEPIKRMHLSDNPLIDKIKSIYDMFREYYPIQAYPHLYNAALSMYLSQNRDAHLSLAENKIEKLSDLYPDILIKSGMSRVISNILARRELDNDFYSRCLISMIGGQFRDDLVDRKEDMESKRVTPFTYSGNQDTNPLYDMFAYDAYLINTLYPGTATILARSHVVFLSRYLSLHPGEARLLLNTFGSNPAEKVLRQFILDASEMSKKQVNSFTSIDQKLRNAVIQATVNRDQLTVDPYIFVLDRVEIINTIIKEFIEKEEKKEKENTIDDIFKITKYALETGGKRLRPVITLMLAESLKVNPTSLNPLLLATELFQTSSLLFDDLPWQDNSSTRRGKAAAHIVYNPASVELASVHMLLEGMGLLKKLEKDYSLQSITEVLSYITSAIKDICKGQDMDLHMKKENAVLEDILKMYHLKTAVAMEASLIPLMILENRPQKEIDSLKKYAHHAGLVFQLKDDLLDISSSTEELGKDTKQDILKVNVVQLYGAEKATELMEYHLQEAITSCEQLPFNTNLLQGIVHYFAKRRR